MSTEFINDQWRLPNEENKSKVSNYSMDFLTTTRIPDITGLGLGTSVDTFSISLWFNKSNMNYGIVFSTYSGTGSYITSGVAINLYTDGTIGLYNGAARTTTSAQYSINTWYNLVVTSDGTTVKMYVNGSQVTLNSTTAVARDFTNVWINSAKYSASNFGIVGKIDGVAIFDYALSSSQVTTLYGSSSTGIGNPMSLSPKPVAYYPLGDQDAFNGSNYLVPNSSLKDYVFSFSGGSVSTSSTYSVLDGANKLTISFWAKSTSAATSVPLRIGTNPNRQIYITIQSGGRIIFRKNENGDNTYLRADSGTPHDGNWNHILISMDLTASPRGDIYFNGNNITYLNTLDTNAIQTSTGSLLVGDSANFLGNIAQLAIWSGTDLRNDVATIYNNGSPNDLNNNGLTAPTTWYKLNASDTYDGTNWTIEDHAGSNDGTSSGMTQANLVQSDLSFTSGYSPYALDFDGTDDYIDCGDSDDFSFGDGTNDSPFSYSTWVNMDDATSFVLFSKYPDDNAHTKREYRIFISNADKPYLILYDAETTSSINYRVATNAITSYQNQWINLTFTYDGRGGNLAGDGIKIYLNGSSIALDATISSSYVSMHNTSTPARIGRTLTSYPNGKIANCSLWNTALTSAQVSELYNEGVPSNLNNHSAYTNLVSWWQLGSNSSFNTNWTVLDEKGSNNGTSANMGEDAIVDGVGSYANGTSSGMGGDEVIGDAPYSTANALSVNMDVEDRVTDTPS